MPTHDLKSKSLVFGPTIILSFLIVIYMLLFLFWIVEDVSDSDDERIFLHAKYLSEILERDSILTSENAVEIAKKCVSTYPNVFHEKALVLAVWENQKLVFHSSPQTPLSEFTPIFRKKNYAIYYYNADFIHRSTYVITYSFKKHATIAWISLVLLIVSILTSRRWIQRNLHINRLFQLHSEWSRIGRIASGLIHEIRNPLNAIKVNSQLIEEDIVNSSM